MIYFCAVNDISIGSKFYNSVELPSKNNDKIRWGITELSSNTFIKVNKDDLIFFYFKGNIIGIGKVMKTEVDKDLSEKLWGINKHKLNGDIYWSNIIYFSAYNSISFPFDKIIEIGNYSENFLIRRIIGLNKTGEQRIIKDFGNEANFIEDILKNYSNQNS